MKKNILLSFTFLLINFNSLSEIITLDNVLKISLENNLQIKISENDVSAIESKKGQGNALYKPKLKLSGGYVHFSETPDLAELARKLGLLNNAFDKYMDLMVTLNPTNPYYQQFASALNQVELQDDGLNYGSAKITFEQPLYTGGKIKAINRQLDISIDITTLEELKTKSDVVFDTKKAYYNVVLAKKTLKTVNEIYKDIEKHVVEAETYYKAGLVPQLDVIRAKAKLSEVNQKVIQAKNAVEVSKSYLNFVIGKDLPADFEVDTNINIVELSESYSLLEKEALKNRVELRIYEDKIKLAKENKKVVSSQYKPLIAIQGQYGYEGTDLLEEEAEWQIGIVGTMNIYDGGNIKSQVNEAENVIKKAENGKSLVENSIKIEVKKAYLDLVNAYESIKVSEKTLEQAIEANRIAGVNYSSGYGSSIEKMDAEAFLEQAKNSYDNALNAYIVAKYNLEKSIGLNY
ncbi:MAG: TolC family protein [Fusobacteriaceae bacterium]|nr:TolC family protein [Fusobacteriaceae bacterium]MBN2837816.1 TolC family protein [Fusobacteriaceae bacterium]